jgi:transcriptional regulator with XRE-family HTH domain
MEQLVRLRELKGFSQRALAKESGVSPATIYELENGRRRPNPSTLRKLAGALDVEVADLLGADYPKEERRSSPEPTLFNGLEDERRGYPYPWMTNTLARVIEDWQHTVEDPSKRGPAHTKEDPAYSRAIYRRAIATACSDVIAGVVLIERDTLHSGEEWNRLPESEKRERLEVAKRLDALARQALEQYKASEAAQEADVEALELRREHSSKEIRQLTAEISA